MFRIFTPLLAEFDRMVASFASTVSSRVMVAITPVVRAALVLWVLWWAVMFMSGHGPYGTPLVAFVRRYLRNAIVISFALTAGYYESTVAAVVESVPDDLAAAVMGPEADGFYVFEATSSTSVERTAPFDPTGAGRTQGAILDVAAGQGIAAANDALKKGGFFREDGVVFLTFGILLLLSTVAFVGLGAAIIITAKLVLGILVGLGPLFIAALLFEPTRQFFSRWVGMVATYGLVVVLFSALFTFMLGIFAHYMSGVRLDGGVNAGYAIAGALILSIVSILVLREVKPLAMGLAGGVWLPSLTRGWWDKSIGPGGRPSSRS
jgi:type IV secretion system protein VirB6